MLEVGKGYVKNCHFYSSRSLNLNGFSGAFQLCEIRKNMDSKLAMKLKLILNLWACKKNSSGTKHHCFYLRDKI